MSLPRHTYATETYWNDDIHQRVTAYVKDHPAVRIDISLVYQNDLLWSGMYGDGAGETTTDRKSIFRAGSISKTFTALAVMQLEDRGVIDIDQPVFAYLPRFSVKRRFSNANPITIRHLLTHHAGLPSNLVKGQWSDVHFSTVIEQLRNAYLSFPPDFVRSYSNIGYSLLGALIEEVSDQSYESYVEENILSPLNMKDSGFSASTIHDKNFVRPEEYKSGSSLLPIRDVPAMGFYTTAADMARFLKLLVNQGEKKYNNIIHYSVLEQMMERNNTHVALDYDQESGIGFLLNHCVFEYPGDVIERGGQTMHYSNHFIALPEYGVAAIVMSNSRSNKKFLHKLASDLVGDVMRKYYPQAKKSKNMEIVEVKDEFTKERARTGGQYLTRSGLLSLQVDEDDMCACMRDQRYDLVPAPDGWYGIDDMQNESAINVQFSPQNIEGEKVLVVRKGGRSQRYGEYIPESGISPLWRERLGDYSVENPDPRFPFDEVCLVEEDNLMLLSYRMPMLSDKRIDIPLTVLDDKQAITTGLGRGRGETVLVESTAEGEYLLYSGYLMKKDSR